VVGAGIAECQGDGTWNHPVAQCQRVWCPPLESPPHTFMMGVCRQFGDVVRFACQQGHRLFGSQDLVCEAGGAWSGSVPACHRVWCEPPVLGVGQRLVQGHKLVSSPHRAVVRVECEEGFMVRGELDIVCRANGRWSRPEGACHRLSCGPPSSEPGVSLLSSTFLYGSKVPFVCPSGQYPVNSPLHCTAKGTWSDGPARCR